MNLLKRIRKFFAPKCSKCGEPMMRHHTDLIEGTVYYYCSKCDRTVHF